MSIPGIHLLQYLLHPFYQFVFPPTCAACGAGLTEGQHTICQQCASSIRMAAPNDRLYLETAERLLSDGSIASLVVLGYFEKDGPLQALVHRLKYDGMTRLGEGFGRDLGLRVRAEVTDLSPEGIIPVPLHRTRARERGYNQAASIARGISSVLTLPVIPDLLVRRRCTVSQTSLDMETRRRNVHDAFSLRCRADPRASGRRFILVDDVITTGATLQSCARVLRAAGAEACIACAVGLAT